MNTLVIVRHGLTEWTTKFTGWTDIDLAPEGIEMTKKFALRLKEKGYKFDIGFTSVLKRGIKTLETVLKVLGQEDIPIIKDWHLNERNYGDLQGQNKAEVVAKYGEEQVALWRRSYSAAPPSGESLKDTYERSVPYFINNVLKEVNSGKKVILSGHHNSLRAIIKYLDNLTDEEIVKVNVPYCVPLVYEFAENLKPVNHYYLGTDTEVKEIVDSIKNQTKK